MRYLWLQTRGFAVACAGVYGPYLGLLLIQGRKCSCLPTAAFDVILPKDAARGSHETCGVRKVRSLRYCSALRSRLD